MQGKISCTAQGCKQQHPPEAMWLPEWAWLTKANGGERVPSDELYRFALCRRHGNTLRKKEMVRVYRFRQSVEQQVELEERRAAERQQRKLVVEMRRGTKKPGTSKTKSRRKKPKRRGGLGYWSKVDRTRWLMRGMVNVMSGVAEALTAKRNGDAPQVAKTSV